MGWRDRDYARDDRPGFGTNPFLWLLSGRVRLFEVLGVTVSAHASLIVLVVLLMLFGGGWIPSPMDRLLFVVTLVGIILLHEFGHIFAARWTGGEGRDIELTPLGGLAMAQPGRGWYPHTIMIVGGPAVNVLICLVAGGLLWFLSGYEYWPLGPFSFGRGFSGLPSETAQIVFYVYAVSYFLLLFNLLPVYPLDGGQLLQGLLWWKLGWYKATMVATGIGLVGSILLGLYAIASGAIILLFIGISCGMTCWQIRTHLKQFSPYDFGSEDEPDYSRSLRDDPTDEPKVGLMERVRQKRANAREEAAAQAAQALERDVDRILAKISQGGMASLTKREKATLERARSANS